MKAARFVWEAAGRPPLIETDGTPIRPRFTTPALCASCGSEDCPYGLDDAISEKFTTVRNNNVLWPFGGKRICQPCAWACKTLALRCAMAFARLDDAGGNRGVWFLPMRPPARPADWPRATPWPFTKPDTMLALLNPPPPPFVAWCPLYGVNHGGEVHVHRCFWPDEHGVPRQLGVPLSKLQTKHTVPYAKVSRNRLRYDLSIDEWNVTIDVPTWTAAREVSLALLHEMRAAGVGAMDARASLVSLRPPKGAPLSLSAPSAWKERVEPLRPHINATWWSFFTELLPMPSLPSDPE